MRFPTEHTESSGLHRWDAVNSPRQMARHNRGKGNVEPWDTATAGVLPIDESKILAVFEDVSHRHVLVLPGRIPFDLGRVDGAREVLDPAAKIGLVGEEPSSELPGDVSKWSTVPG